MNKHISKTEYDENEKRTSLGADIAAVMKTPGFLRRKAILLLATFVLLIALIAAGTLAWYTRISNVTGISMNAATFDFNANYVKHDAIVSASGYHNVAGGFAAPGVSGVLPIKLTATGSNVAIHYSIALDFDGMAPEFKERIRYFYYTEVDGEVVEVTIRNRDAQIEGDLDIGQEQYEYIYWEWLYELDPNKYYDEDLGLWVINNQYVNHEGETVDVDTTKTFTPEAIEIYDDVDTKIGLKKCETEFVSRNGKTYYDREEDAATQTTAAKAYQVAMEAKLNVLGVQAEPITDNNAVTNGTGMTVTRPSDWGTAAEEPSA